MKKKGWIFAPTSCFFTIFFMKNKLGWKWFWKDTHTKNSSKFIAVPSGGPASRGGAVKNGEDGGNGHANTLRGNVS